MLNTIQLVEAIAEIEKMRIHRKHMVILAPTNTLAMLLRDSENGVPRLSKLLCRVSPGKNPRFNGVLVIEDESHSEIVVKSLISEHRVRVKYFGG